MTNALQVLVLGSAAGGGFPQWNCGCANCVGVRAGHPGLTPRTQDSVAVSADGRGWFLLNASPDVLQQIQRNRQLWPSSLRSSPILGVVLTNGDLDHVLGLLQLRESHPLSVYATSRVREGLMANPMFRTLQRFEGQLRWHTLVLEQACQLVGVDDAPSGISVTAYAVAGKLPLHLAGALEPAPEDNLALRLQLAGGRALVYASAFADSAGVLPLMNDCGVLLADGTFWSEDELPGLGVRMGPARSMAHQPIGGAQGSMLALRQVQGPRRLYTHVNNTNPVLDPSSAEAQMLAAAGWEVAADGLLLSV
jgi:pyrroloquinoline quinone biosynthesis protein B